MGSGYSTPAQGELGALIRELQSIQRRLDELETPTGTSVNSLVAQVQQAIANITATVTAAIDLNSYTKAEIDAKVASPGAITPTTVTASGAMSATDVTASGQVSSNGAPLKSQPSYNYPVATSYKGAWIDGATYQIGYSSSAGVTKTGLTAMTADDVNRFLSLTPYWGRYVWDADDSPAKVFLLAGDVQAAGFGPDVAPVVDTTEPLHMVGPDGASILGTDGNPVVIPVGEAYSINYSQLVVPLLAVARAERAARTDLEARVSDLETLMKGRS
ncbi:hypothetical protein RR49_01152 [Microbacterium ginsengisoli]|uniref:Peptidase S74 domain-containing protein n=1 Tax=Microbacterium ginsengisoli TaxID=400772 RepID=A0A0F0LXM7_9MICO|nr:hypothetical protein [Microbacterium ginsengisoli]KJL37040.1 hypothetical protein RR49_01152 [Microbacterium ginsengisoli]